MEASVRDRLLNKAILPERFAALRGKTVLVTGAAGFIGGHLARRLESFGLDVINTVLYPEEQRRIVADGHKAVVLDLASDESWDQVLSGVDIVFNIAAMFQETDQAEDVFEKVNHQGALKLCRAAARAGVARFVHCSTVGVHGDVKEIPATEETPFNPMDAYHRTKLSGELAILEFARSLPDDGMTVVVNRPAMVYGPGDLRMLKLFKSILAGTFRMIGSGATLAHLGYIEDQTESFLLCAVAPRERVHCEEFNIASDEPIALDELAEIIAECGGVKLSKMRIPLAPVWFAGLACEWLCKPLPIRPPISRRRIGFFTHNRAFNLSKAERHLGYRSSWNHRTGVEETIAWYRNNKLL